MVDSPNSQRSKRSRTASGSQADDHSPKRRRGYNYHQYSGGVRMTSNAPPAQHHYAFAPNYSQGQLAHSAQRPDTFTRSYSDQLQSYNASSPLNDNQTLNESSFGPYEALNTHGYSQASRYPYQSYSHFVDSAYGLDQASYNPSPSDPHLRLTPYQSIQVSHPTVQPCNDTTYSQRHVSGFPPPVTGYQNAYIGNNPTVQNQVRYVPEAQGSTHHDPQSNASAIVATPSDLIYPPIQSDRNAQERIDPSKYFHDIVDKIRASKLPDAIKDSDQLNRNLMRLYMAYTESDYNEVSRKASPHVKNIRNFIKDTRHKYEIDEGYLDDFKDKYRFYQDPGQDLAPFRKVGKWKCPAYSCHQLEWNDEISANSHVDTKHKNDGFEAVELADAWRCPLAKCTSRLLANQPGVESHIRYQHPRLYVCIICEKQGTFQKPAEREQNLREHMRKTHPNGRYGGP